MQRKSYTREFKIKAVQLMGESFKPICRLAEELGVISTIGEGNFERKRIRHFPTNLAWTRRNWRSVD